MHLWCGWTGLIHTRHVNHPAVAVLQQVPGLTVDAAGADAVCGEVLGLYGSGLAVTPRWREILKLRKQMAHVVSQRVSRTKGMVDTKAGQVQRKTTSRQNPTHISNINESIKPIIKEETEAFPWQWPRTQYVNSDQCYLSHGKQSCRTLLMQV